MLPMFTDSRLNENYVRCVNESSWPILRELSCSFLCGNGKCHEESDTG